MEEFAEKKGLVTQLGKKLLSSCFLENGTIVTPLLFLFGFRAGLQKTHRFLELHSLEVTNLSSLQLALKETDEIRNFSVVDDALKLPANRLYGYQIIGGSRKINKVSQSWKDTSSYR